MRMIEAAKVPPLIRLLLMKHPHAEEVMENMQFVIDQHTVDAVPVVQCRECKHSRETDMFGERTVLICGKTDYVKQPDGYCDEGERKDGDG